MSERLTCFISAASDDDLPDDNHPFWAEIDALSDKIVASLKARNVAPDTFVQATGNGSLLTISSDTPSGVLYIWIELPTDVAVRARWLSMALDHLTRARSAFPNLEWDVRIGAHTVKWRDGRFQCTPDL